MTYYIIKYIIKYINYFNRKTKVVLYLRVSTDRQFMERQEKELTEYAHFKNWDIVTILYEEISGRKTNRDGVRKLLELAKEKK